VDWRVTLKHGERAIRLGLDITGLGRAQRLSRFLPDKLALVLGLLPAALSFGVQKLRGLKFSFVEAITSFCGLVPAAVGTVNIVFDLAATRRFRELLKPLKLFGKNHIAAVMFDFADAQYLMSYGKEKEATELLEELHRVFPDPRWKLKEELGEAHYKAMFGGVMFSLGIMYPYEFGGRAIAMARELEELGVRVWAMAAEEVRMLHHAMRGEAEAVQRFRERVELFAVQGSTTWQADIFWPILLMDSEIRAGDTIAVRTIREQLARRAKDHPSLQAFADVAHCSYLAMRGEHVAAIAAFENLHERLRTLEPALAWPALRASFAFASALNAAGEHARAKQYTCEILERAGKDVASVVGHYLEPQRQLALAEAGLGNHAEAVAILDGLLVAHGGEDQPLIIGLLHKARAEVAIAMSDKAAFEVHFVAAMTRFREAKNATLIAQGDQLAKRAERAAIAVPRMTSAAPRASIAAGPAPESISILTQRALSDVSGVSERADLALKIILKDSRAKAGSLYLLKGGRLELAASSTAQEPTPECEARLLSELVQAQQRELEAEAMTAAVDALPSGEERSVFIESVTPVAMGASSVATVSEDPYRVLVLSTKRGGDLIVVGGLIVELREEREFTINAELLEPIAAALLESSSGV
jgi:hypothetical protein